MEKGGKSESQFPIITVIGKDHPGIVAQISALLWANQINIEEISQGVIKGNFFMVMAVDLKNAKIDFAALAQKLKPLGKKIGADISLYNQEIFTAMNRI